jgi:hypothetical protein
VKKLLLIVFAVAIAAALPFVAVRADDSTMPAVGQPAPTFTLPSQTGEQISLDSFRGKWVVLYFYPKDMTSGCTIEAHKFQDALPQFEAKNAVILGVSVDTVDSRPRPQGRERIWVIGRICRNHDGQSEHLPYRSARQDRPGLAQGESEHLGLRCACGDSVSSGSARSPRLAFSAIAVDRRHTAKWLFPKEKATFTT